MRVWALAVLMACGGRSDPTDPPPNRVDRAPTPLAPTPVPQQDGDEPAPATPDFPEGTRSLELTRMAAVRLEPADTAKRIGTVAVDTRVGWVRTQSGKGCTKSWIEIKPHGWVCGDYVKTSTKPAVGKEVPFLDRGEIVPGTYGKVTAPSSVTYTFEKPKKEDKKKKKGPITVPKDTQLDKGPKLVESRPLVGSVNVREYEEITVDGKLYWKISRKDPEYVLRAAITPHRPSVYAGSRLGDDTGWTIPIAFVWPRVLGWQQVGTTYKPLAGGQNRLLPMRMAIPILETYADKQNHPLAYRIGDEEWIAAADVRMFAPAAPPPLLQPSERWIDVDVDNQILVAYEGELPVYATMVSSGAKDTPTETGIYRMWIKESEADMNGLNGEDPYSVATVPWTQFFNDEKGLALHAAYWHDAFGTRRSHGCVNLAPRDARWLYFWSDPQVPPGWTMAAGNVDVPGSIVRIRTKDEPMPPFRGYAKKVQEARQQNAPVK
jgi:L,D-transpeptidase-like protein